MKEILAVIKDEHDLRSMISRLPPYFFVWSNDLENGEALSCVYAHNDSMRPCPFGIDWNPSLYLYDDLITECPDFSSNPHLSRGSELSGRALRRQQTEARYTR